MSPRPRKRGNRDLPSNLYLNGRGTYYYRHPVTKKDHGMGSDRQKAIAAATILNAKLQPAENLVAKVLGASTLTDVIGRFRSEYLEDKQLSDRSRSEADIRLNRIMRDLGDRAWDAVTLEVISGQLRPLTREAYRKYRGQWIDIYRFACSVGLADRNIADLTLSKPPAERKRKRWTLETYKAARAKAEPWLQDAMDLALTSLQRREDLVGIRKKEDFEGGRLLVRQHKTGARLAIEPVGTLVEVIKRARARHPFCPFLLGRKPLRDIRGSKVHPYQITPGMLSRAVAKARDASGAFEDWPSEEKPTLHELRSLGAHLYREAGYPEEYIQALLGHEAAAMTRHYLDGHKEEWVDVKAGLVVDL